MSSEKLARLFPIMPVIGIDRSLNRLSCNKHFFRKPRADLENSHGDEDTESESEENADALDVGGCEGTSSDNLANLLLVRADLPSFLSLAFVTSDWTIAEHYILHPNPYPTQSSASSRLYELPFFPLVIALGGKVTCRSMWRTYLEELLLALQVNAKAFGLLNAELPATPSQFPPACEPMTHFERKYVAAKVPIYEVVADLGERDQHERSLLLSTFLSSPGHSSTLL
eukprot:gene27809-33583_t